MIIAVTDQGVELQQPDDLKRFNVAAARGLDVDRQLQHSQWGSCADDSQAMIAVDAIRRAVGHASAEWNAQFDAMLAYAASKGWMSDDSTQIAAHVERTD